MFDNKKIRRVLHREQWFFSVVDIVGALIESKDIKQYIKKMRQRDEFLSKGWVQIVHPLKLETSGGIQLVNCANKEGIFRIIQSIPSKRAEPFKLWLAKVGSERIDEIENPELAQNRAKEYYEKKGYSKSWIDKRIRGIAVRQDLTKEWDGREVKEGREYAILTNEISNATFGIPISEHKKIKGLNPLSKNENLRDGMTDLELIFSMLGEASTTEIVKEKDVRGFEENKIAAIKGGRIAGEAREKLERELNKKVVSKNSGKEAVKLNEMKKYDRISVGGQDEK